MVFSPMHLGVLWKLEAQGPLKSGVHPSVSTLAKRGFVDEDDAGYSINEQGKLALIAYDKLNDFHRQILMQLYRARFNEEQVKSAAFKTYQEDNALEDLVAWGYVRADGNNNLDLTSAGQKLWLVVTEAHTVRDDEVADAIRQGQKESAAKKTREQETVDKIVAASVASNEKPAAPMPVVIPPITETVAGDCPDCSSCIDAEVLKLIAAKYPKVAELRATLLKEKQLLKDLGL